MIKLTEQNRKHVENALAQQKRIQLYVSMRP